MPDSIFYNLLDEPFLGAEDDAGVRVTVTLSGLLGRLSQGVPTSLTAVQAHQQHAVHAFLVQLAALALARAGETELAHDEARWRELLVACAKEDGSGPEAFALVVEGLAKPAFLQPPVPEGTLDVLQNEHTRPSAELDVLVTSKNHDVKVDRLGRPSLEHWILALITLQTMQGFLGAGNYGVARMNGGFASRPCVAFAADFGVATRFRRDLLALLEHRAALQERFAFGSRGHLGLVWCAPWDGTTSLTPPALDPFFIEICRRVRLSRSSDSAIAAHRGTSAVPRIDAKDARGNLGDAWTPVARKDGKALTLPEAGFTYDRVQELLLADDWQHGAAGRPAGSDRLWLGQVLVRGQGTTGGYHERWVPVPERASSFLSRPERRSVLAARAQGWVGRAETVRRKILRPALLILMQGGPEKDLKFDDKRADGYLRTLDLAIDVEFFPLLFEHVEESPEAADATFERRLFELAGAQLDAAIRSLPVPSARKWRAEARALRAFHLAARKHFKLAFPPRAPNDPPPPTTGDVT
jgi:CRISPR system Cascade subunit CasA